MSLSETSSKVLNGNVGNNVVNVLAIHFILRLIEVTETFESQTTAVDILAMVCDHHVEFGDNPST